MFETLFHRVKCPTLAHAEALANYLTQEDAFASVVSDGTPTVIAQCTPALMAHATRFCSV